MEGLTPVTLVTLVATGLLVPQASWWHSLLVADISHQRVMDWLTPASQLRLDHSVPWGSIRMELAKGLHHREGDEKVMRR